MMSMKKVISVLITVILFGFNLEGQGNLPTEFVFNADSSAQRIELTSTDGEYEIINNHNVYKLLFHNGG